MEKVNSFEEWVLGLRQARTKGCMQEDEFFETVLDYPEWRIQGLRLVMDCLDFSRDVIPGHCLPPTWPAYKGERRDAIRVFLKYLGRTCEVKGQKEFYWAVDCVSNPDLLMSMARSLRILKRTWRMEPEELEPIKQLLAHVHQNQIIFLGSSKGAREEFYLALADYEMYDLLPSSTLIKQTILAHDPQDHPRTWGEWLEGLMRSSDDDEYLAYLGTALDFYAKRPRGVRFLLDLMDYSDPEKRIEPHIYVPQKDRYANGYTFLRECKTRAADLICLEYLKRDPNEQARVPWVDDCKIDPELLPRILRSLINHALDQYLADKTCHPRSAVKKFLKSCAETGWEKHEESSMPFTKIRDANLVLLYEALAIFDMPDLIKSHDEASLEALRQIVFAPRKGSVFDGGDPPETLHDALLSHSRVRRACADRLYLLRGIEKAKRLRDAIKRRDKNRQARTERAKRVLDANQTPRKV